MGIHPGIVGWLGMLSSILCLAGVELPRLDRSQVEYVHEFGTVVRLDSKNDVCVDRPARIWNDQCRERYDARQFPFPARQLRDYLPGEEVMGPYDAFEGLDVQDNPWFCTPDANKGIAIWSIQQRRLTKRTVPGGFASLDGAASCLPAWPWAGRNMLRMKSGELWCIARDRFSRIDGQEQQEVLLPVPEDETEIRDLLSPMPERSPYWQHQLYGRDGSLWMVRDFTSNCTKPGSFVFRVADGQALLMLRTFKEHVAGIVFHKEAAYVLIDQRMEEYPNEYKPIRIARIRTSPADQRPVPVIKAKIAELDSDDPVVREAASEFLATLPEGQVPLLRQAVDKAVSPEQQFRLEQAIRIIGTRKPEVVEGPLDDMVAGRLLFVDPAGRQYVQAWKDGKAQPSLAVVDGKTVTSIALESAAFSVDCAGDDGNIYAHDQQKVYTVDVAAKTCRPVALWGDIGDHTVRIMAVRKGMICLALKTEMTWDKGYVPTWVSLGQANTVASLPGEPIAKGLPLMRNDQPYFPVAAGAGENPDCLWFIRGVMDAQPFMDQVAQKVQIARVRGTSVEELTPEGVPVSYKPSIWPVGPDTAIVAAMAQGRDGGNGVAFYDQGKASSEPSLTKLVEKHHTRLKQTMEDGVALSAGAEYEHITLARSGDALYVEDYLYQSFHNGGGFGQMSGVLRDGQWIRRNVRQPGPGPDVQYTPIIQRLVGFDTASHRVLGFDDSWQTLKWFSLASDAQREEVLEPGGKPEWAWYWANSTSRPKCDGGWVLTAEAREHWQKMHPQRLEETRRRGVGIPAEVYTEYHADDFPAFRRWRDGKWQEVKASLYGGAVWEDWLGNVWHFRVREATVISPDGKQQLLPLDAGVVEQYRLVPQSTGAVWVATQHSLCLYVYQKDKEHPGTKRWVLEQRYSLPRLGMDFAGPWVIGNDLYYVSGRQLFHVTRQALLGVETR